MCIFFGNIKLLFSEKSGVWSNGTVVFGLPIEPASCLKLSISNLIIVFLVSSSSQSRLLSSVFAGSESGGIINVTVIFNVALL